MDHAGQGLSVGGCCAIAGTVMNSEVTWLEQRISLLQTHLQELNELSAAEEQARQSLKNQHQQEKSLFFSAQDKPIRWAELLAGQARQLADLVNTHRVMRALVLARQKKEVLDLERWIDLETNRIGEATRIAPKEPHQNSRDAPASPIQHRRSRRP